MVPWLEWQDIKANHATPQGYQILWTKTEIISQGGWIMKLWQYPTNAWQWPLFAVGFSIFWMSVPIWLICGVFWWRRDTAFILLHIQAMFYNPWRP
jgi:hypothetical protein